MSYDRSKDPRADKVLYDALAPPTKKRPLTRAEYAARTHAWLSYSAVIKFKNGDEDVVTVTATDEADARHRIGLRLSKGDKIINDHLILNGEAY